MSGLFENIARPLLFSLDPETAHDVVIRGLRAASNSKAVMRMFGQHVTPSPRNLFGLTFPNAVGLAAGFDKNGVAIPALAVLGFGFIEIGTVTAKAQSGNPKPRIFRLPAEQGLINRLGFNNDGADVIAERLRQLRKTDRWPPLPIGINIGKSQDTPMEQAISDYLYSFAKLAPLGDYIVVNVSSPNTPGLRSLQEKNSLGELLSALQAENRSRKPLLIKIAPDLTDDELQDIVKVCEQQGVAGIIATNTTLDHTTIPASQDQTGGLSGAPLRPRATEVVRMLAALTKIPIIASGGIMSGSAAEEKFAAGAELVQVYTGLVFRGPSLIKEINAALH